MNRYTINSSNLNTERQTAVQRAIVTMVAVAAGVAKYRVFFLAKLAASSTATIGYVQRVLARSVTAASAAATATIVRQNKYWARIGSIARSSAHAVGTVFVRHNISGAVNLSAAAVIWANSIKIGRIRVNPQAIADMAITGKNYYTRWLAQAGIIARAAPVIDFETRKQIPFDEYAPDIRTMRLAQDNRLMQVN